MRPLVFSAHSIGNRDDTQTTTQIATFDWLRWSPHLPRQPREKWSQSHLLGSHGHHDETIHRENDVYFNILCNLSYWTSKGIFCRWKSIDNCRSKNPIHRTQIKCWIHLELPTTNDNWRARFVLLFRNGNCSNDFGKCSHNYTPIDQKWSRGYHSAVRKEGDQRTGAIHKDQKHCAAIYRCR